MVISMVAAVTGSTIAATTNSLTFTVPATVAPGDKVNAVVVHFDRTLTVSVNAGPALTLHTAGSSATIRADVWTHTVDWSETSYAGTQVTFTPATSDTLLGLLYIVRGNYGYELGAPTLGTLSSGTSYALHQNSGTRVVGGSSFHVVAAKNTITAPSTGLTTYTTASHPTESLFIGLHQVNYALGDTTTATTFTTILSSDFASATDTLSPAPSLTLPANELLAGAIPLTAGADPVTVNLSNARHEPGEQHPFEVTGNAVFGQSPFGTIPFGGPGPVTAAFTPTTTGAVTSVNATASVPGVGQTMVGYDWDWGDGTAHGSGVTASHTYSASGPYTLRLVATDSFGTTGQTSHTVNPTVPVTGGGGGSPVYTIGSPTDDIPGGVTVYDFTALGLSGGVTDVQTIVDALPGPGIVQLPTGFDGVIPNFSHHGSNFGIYNSNFRGFLGGVSGGVLQARISMAGNAMTSAQLAMLSANTRGSTTQIGAIHTRYSGAYYFGGVQFDGADQQTFTDSYNGRTGPAIWGGFFLNGAGANSIFQNCLLKGFGCADDTTAPGDVGNWSEARTSGFTFRRVEHDGRIPGVGTDPLGRLWRRGGGLCWNAATGFLMEDVYSHDTWTSGVNMSFIGPPSTTSNDSRSYTTRRLHVEHNSGHAGTSGNAPAINMDFNYGTIHHRQPHLALDDYSDWTTSHIKMTVAATIAGIRYVMDPTTQLYVHQPVWDNANSLDNGCFSIYYAGYNAASTTGWTYPIVYLTGDEGLPAIPYLKTASTAVPSNITTANNYYILKLK